MISMQDTSVVNPVILWPAIKRMARRDDLGQIPTIMEPMGQKGQMKVRFGNWREIRCRVRRLRSTSKRMYI